MFRLQPRHEEDAIRVQSSHPREVDVAAIHRNDASSRHLHRAGDPDVGLLAVGHDGDSRKISAVVEHRVDLDGALPLPKLRPRKSREAEVDCRRVDRVERVLELEAVGRGEGATFRESPLEQRLVDLPGPVLVRVCERAAPNVADAQVVELGLSRGETVLDIAKAVPSGELREEHRVELAPASQLPTAAIGLADDRVKLMSRRELQELLGDSVNVGQGWVLRAGVGSAQTPQPSAAGAIPAFFTSEPDSSVQLELQLEPPPTPTRRPSSVARRGYDECFRIRENDPP